MKNYRNFDMYDPQKIKRALLNYVCTGAEGHRPESNAFVQSYYDQEGVVFVAYRCEKCACLVWVPERDTLLDGMVGLDLQISP